MGTENLEVKNLNPNHKSRLLKIIVSIETMLVIAAIHQSLSGKLLITGAVIFAFTLILPAYFLIKKDKLNINYNVFLVFLTILVLSFIWLFNGLRDEVLFTIPAIIMLSLLMCSQRFTLYLYLFICLNILAIGYLNQFNYMIHKSDEASIEVALLLIIIFTFISYVAWLISIEMKQTNKALIESKNELEDRVKQRTLELEQSLKNLTSTQEQLVNTEKMASLGRLVAGVAHEINTPVGIAITASSHLEDRTDRFSERYENQGISQKFMANYLETAKSSSELIQSNLKRAADLIQGFKEVAVDQSSDEIRKFELTEYIKEVFSKCKYEFGDFEYEYFCGKNKMYRKNGSLFIDSKYNKFGALLNYKLINEKNQIYKSNKVIILDNISKNTEEFLNKYKNSKIKILEKNFATCKNDSLILIEEGYRLNRRKIGVWKTYNCCDSSFEEKNHSK